MKDTSDIELMRRVAAQDQTAFSALYQRFGSLIYSLTLRIIDNADLAEEVTQDVFLKVWNQAERWDPERGTLSTWLLIITRSTAIDRLRKENRHLSRTETMTENVAEEPEQGIPWHDKYHLQKLLGSLPQEQRLLIEMAFLKGFTHRELAEHLDLPLGTVKHRIRSGLMKLKDMWQASLEPSRLDRNS